MSSQFDIAEARPWHCGQLARTLRREHQNVVATAGMDCHRELRHTFDQSTFRRAWYIGGKLAGLAGVTAPALSTSGFVWAAFSQAATRYPRAIVRDATRILTEATILKKYLFCSILEDDTTSLRFAIFLGFVPATPERIEPAISRFGREEVLRELNEADEIRIPFGAGYAKLMIYQGRGS